MRIRTLLAVGAMALAASPAGATHVGTGRPDCVTKVPASAGGSHSLTDFKTTGFGGGFIGNIQLPAVANVVPAPTALEADVVGALLNLDFVGVLGGGTTVIRPLGGLPGVSIAYSGAQRLTSSLFTGHFKAVPRSYECESVVRLRTIIRYSYFEITLSGLLTPLVAGSPLNAYASGLQVGVAPGDISSL